VWQRLVFRGFADFPISFFRAAFVTLAHGNQAKATFANGDLIRTPKEGHVTKHVAQPA